MYISFQTKISPFNSLIYKHRQVQTFTYDKILWFQWHTTHGTNIRWYFYFGSGYSDFGHYNQHNEDSIRCLTASKLTASKLTASKYSLRRIL